MTITVDTRTEQIEGLRRLADFLDTHPAVPIPSISIPATYHADRRQAIAQWVADLDTFTPEPTTYSPRDFRITRRFAGLEVRLLVGREDIGSPTDVTKTVTEWTPLSVAEILDRAEAAS